MTLGLSSRIRLHPNEEIDDGLVYTSPESLFLGDGETVETVHWVVEARNPRLKPAENERRTL